MSDLFSQSYFWTFFVAYIVFAGLSAASSNFRGSSIVYKNVLIWCVFIYHLLMGLLLIYIGVKVIWWYPLVMAVFSLLIGSFCSGLIKHLIPDWIMWMIGIVVVPGLLTVAFYLV